MYNVARRSGNGDGLLSVLRRGAAASENKALVGLLKKRIHAIAFPSSDLIRGGYAGRIGEKAVFDGWEREKRRIFLFQTIVTH
jgi:hypothetical protein